MAELNMVSYKLQDLQFFNKLDKPGQVQLENNFSFSVSYTPDNTRCIAKLYQCVKDKSDGPDHRFFVSVDLMGVFPSLAVLSLTRISGIFMCSATTSYFPMRRCWPSRCAPPEACPTSCCCGKK